MDDKVTYAVGTLKGRIYFYDRRQPLEQQYSIKTGSTVHSLWTKSNILAAGCEDGIVKVFDTRMYKKKE